MMRARLLAAAAALFGLVFARPASADGPLGPEGSAIGTSDYQIDMTQGVVLSGTRVLGLGGAYVAIAEGFDGSAQTAAAPAVRVADSFDHFDYDIGFGLTFPASVAGNDLFNRGANTNVDASQEGALFLTFGALLQDGRWGFALRADYTTFELAPKNQSLGLVSRFGGVNLQLARSWFDGQLVTGFGSRGSGLAIENRNPQPGEPKELFNIEGASLEIGALWRPNWQRFRVGAAVRSAVVSNAITSQIPRDAAGDRVLTRGTTDLYLPSSATLPWDVNVGVAVQLGARPFNPRWVDPEVALARFERFLQWRRAERARRKRARLAAAPNPAARQAVEAAAEAQDTELATLEEMSRERTEQQVRNELRRRYRAMQRFYVLLSSSLLITGPVKDGVGVEGFTQGQVQRSGQRTTLSPHFGVETELIPDWTKIRAGTYREPTRFANPRARARMHGTFGFDQNLFPWTVFGLFDEDTSWRLSAAMDLSERYFAWGASVGVWH